MKINQRYITTVYQPRERTLHELTLEQHLPEPCPTIALCVQVALQLHTATTMLCIKTCCDMLPLPCGSIRLQHHGGVMSFYVIFARLYVRIFSPVIHAMTFFSSVSQFAFETNLAFCNDGPVCHKEHAEMI